MSVIDNKAKSVKGNEFKNKIRLILSDLHKSKLIDNFESKKRYAGNTNLEPQFYAPFVVESRQQTTILFTTTSLRTDRIKENQWDAYGIKTALGPSVKCILVVPNPTTQKQKNELNNAVDNNNNPKRLSFIDDIIVDSKLKIYYNNLHGDK